MSLVLILSIAIRLVAMSWSIFLLRHIRDWRMGFLTAMLGLMALRQTLTLLTARESWAISIAGHTTELPGLAVSVMGLLAILFLNRMLMDRKQAEDELRKYREQLEALVKARTRELEEKTVELEGANTRLQEADRLKSIFLASMSHELRTPLNSIIGFTGIILMEMVGKINDEQRKQLTMVKNSANHLLNLINDLLDVSKIEADRVELALEEFRLDDVIKEVIETVSPAASEKGLELLTEVPQGITLVSDRRRITQILMNLATSAVKFTEGGNVKISARIKNTENLEMCVTDTGIGIKKEDMNQLFAPFQQIDMSLTKPYEGTGLGLYLTKKLVVRLGGDIWAKSEYGRGSEFTFVLPLKYQEGKR